MAIVFGSDVGITQNAFDNFVSQVSKDLQRTVEGLESNFSRLTGESAGLPPPPPKENVYVDDGFENVPGTSFEGSKISNIDDIKNRRITSQEPNVTVYIKKRLLSSLKQENDTRFMNKGEKLLLRATKILFERKCTQIASYEALTKLSSLLSEEADLDADRLEAFTTSLQDTLASDYDTLVKSDSIQGNVSQVFEEELDKLNKITENLETVIKQTRRARASTYTTWVVDPDDVGDLFNTGRGVGTIEITSISNISTSLGLERDTGNFSFTMSDPYNLTLINEDDIEVALSAAMQDRDRTENNGGPPMFDGPQEILREAQRLERNLNSIRKNKINNSFGLFGRITNGSLLSGSDVSEIIFEINPSSLAKKKIQIGTTNSAEFYDNLALFKTSLLREPIELQLTSEEDQLLTRIFSLLEEYVTQVGRINNVKLNSSANPDIQYARRKLRLFYLGKHIIQPMDSAHIYIRSKTFRDNQVVGPLSSFLNGSSFIQSVTDGTELSDLVIESELQQFGLSDLGITKDLYYMLRTGSFMRNAGIHVFGGLIKSVSGSFSAGQGFSLAVSGSSNLRWLDLSRINTSPSNDQPQGVLEDPLTPFDLDIDPGTGLIKSTTVLLPENAQRANLFYVKGTRKGQKLSRDTMEQDFVNVGDNTLPLFQHTPGLVYKWKEGIIATTLNNNLRTALDGTPNNIKEFTRYMGLTNVSNPFSSLDSADIISLLVTGVPHNYETFALNATHVGSYNPNTIGSSGNSFFNTFVDITRSTNKALGNFQPLGMIVVSPDQVHKRLSLQTDLKNKSSKISELRSKLAKLEDQRLAIKEPEEFKQEKISNKDFVTPIVDRQRAQIDSELNLLITQTRSELNKLEQDFANSITDDAAKNNGFKTYGNDVNFTFGADPNTSSIEEDKLNFKQLQARNSLLTFRPQYSCKYNRDSNFFIVSDEYDKDLDIQAFVLNFGGNTDLFASQYKTPLEVCQDVAEKLDFEFFCDTQGNIVLRPPKFNKVPLSLLAKMLLLNRSERKQLYPPFLQSLFGSKVSSIKNDLEVVEIQISEKELLLGLSSSVVRNKDDSIVISETDKISNITSLGIPQSFTTLSESDATSLAEALLEVRNLKAFKLGKNPTPINEQTIEAAAIEIASFNDASKPNVNSNRLALTNQLAILYSRKQQLLVTQKGLERNKQLFSQSTPSQIGISPSKALTSSEVQELLIPFADLIEDDLVDSLGPGSSNRFIISDDQIISYSFTESDAELYSRVTVTGELDLLSDGPGVQAGMPAITAGATDFDLWRQYGYRPMTPVNKPYFKSADLQCAPYAVMLLSRARKNAITGTITVAGNEYYQLGDVVFVNSRDMLYYVTNIKHDFNYDSGSFQTTLELKYGHPLGEYIPTPFDIIGKNLIKNQTASNSVITARSTANRQLGVHLASIVFPFNSSGTTPDEMLKEMLSGAIGTNNFEVLRNTLLSADKYLTRNKKTFPKLEIRGFKDSETTDVSVVSNRMKAVKNWLLNPVGKFKDNKSGFIQLGKELINKKMQDTDVLLSGLRNDEAYSSTAVIDLDNPSKDDLSNSRLPKEETRSLVVGDNANPTNIIEIVLVYK